MKKDFYFWHNPDNWKDAKAKLPEIIPHLQRVPCRYDEAFFDYGTAPKASVHHHPVDVSRVVVNGWDLNSADFRAIYTSPIGSLTFNINQSFTIHQDHCSNPQGCTCGNQVSKQRYFKLEVTIKSHFFDSPYKKQFARCQDPNALAMFNVQAL